MAYADIPFKQAYKNLKQTNELWTAKGETSSERELYNYVKDAYDNLHPFYDGNFENNELRLAVKAYIMTLKAVLDAKRHILDGSQASDLVAVVAMNDAREDVEKNI